MKHREIKAVWEKVKRTAYNVGKAVSGKQDGPLVGRAEVYTRSYDMHEIYEPVPRVYLFTGLRSSEHVRNQNFQ